MIIFTQTYANAQEAAGHPMLNSRIGWHTITRDAVPSDVSATSETASGPKDAPLRPDTAEFWQPLSMPAVWTFDWGTSEMVDYAAIAAHTCGTSQCVVTAETSNGPGSPTGSPVEDVWEMLATAHSPEDDSPIMFLDSSRAATKMRITFSGSPSSAPQVSVVHVGRILVMQEPIRGQHSPITLNRTTVKYRALSRGGQFLGQNFRRHGLKTTVAYDQIEADWYRDTFDEFVLSARQYPYFFAWRPGQRTDELAYVWTEEDIMPTTAGERDIVSMSWSMQGFSDA